MKKSTIEKIEKEIDQKTRLPNGIKDKIKKEVFTNIAIASIIIIYFIFIVLGSKGTIKNVRTIDLNIFSFIFLSIAIIMFEIAYRKDKGSLAMYGIESLVVSIFTLFLPYIIFELEDKYKKYYLMASIYIAIYYIIKSIYISLKIKNKHMKDISDIKEIVKKEKTKRKSRENLEKIEPKNNKKEKNNADVLHKEPPKTKKRGIPKKTESINKVEEIKNTNTPKKRGRPRKVVVNND